MNKKLILITLALLFPLTSFAKQGFNIKNTGLNELVDYVELNISNAGQDSKDIVITDFFWYGCTHCFKMIPLTQNLYKKYSGKIEVKNQPVVFENWLIGAQVFYALKSANLLEKYHYKVFSEIHLNKNNIHANKENFLKFMEKSGEDRDSLEKVWSSFTVVTNMERGKKITKQYEIDSSPVFVISYEGKSYKVSPGLTGSYEKTIRNMDKILTEIISSKNR